MLNKLYGLLHVAGKDAARFLQGQLTNDINLVSAAQHIRAAVCNLQGRVIVTLQIFMSSPDNYVLLCSSDLINMLQQHLQRYVLRAQVTLTDMSDVYQIHGLYLPNTDDLKRVFPSQPAGNFVMYTHGFALQHSVQTTERWLCITNTAGLDNTVITPYLMDVAAWQCATIAEKIPEINAATSGLFTALSLNLLALGGISLTKGCYIGQEIIARMHYLGKAKEALYALILQSEQKNLPCNGGQRVMMGEQQLGTMLHLCLTSEQEGERGCIPDGVQVLGRRGVVRPKEECIGLYKIEAESMQQHPQNLKGEGYRYIGLAVLNAPMLQQHVPPWSVTLMDSNGVAHPCVIEHVR